MSAQATIRFTGQFAILTPNIFVKFFGVAASSEIRDALKSEDLQKLICSVDDSPNALEVSEDYIFFRA